MDNELEYPYRMRFTHMLLALAFFGGGGILMASVAAGNNKGLIINGLIELGPDGATIFYWCVALTAAGVGIFAVAKLIVGFVNPVTVSLTPRGLTAPRSILSRDHAWIPIGEIQRLHKKTFRRWEALAIYHRREKLTLARAMFPDDQTYETFKRELVDAIQPRDHRIGRIV